MSKPVKTRKHMGAKSKAAITLIVLLVLTIALGIISTTGLRWGEDGLYRLLPWVPVDADNWPESIALGLDLRGGVYVEYQATKPEEADDATFSVLIENTMDVIRTRLTDQGYPEATVTQIGTDGIRVEIPDVTDPNAILDLIGTPAELEFKSPDGETFMTGKQVKTAGIAQDTSSIDNYYVVSFELNEEGTQLFADMTTASVGKTIGIYLDGKELMAPTVNEAITSGSGQISGNFSYEDARTLAIQIQSGALPLTLTQQKVDTISATLGVDALQTSLLAAGIGILLVMLIMIFRYRLSGVAASWALVIYIILLFWLTAMLPGIQLTLPGIAGVILGIGMAVDANVVIFERFGEELRKGRPVKLAAKAGFKNAFSAILDANVTTMIAAIVLMIFGTGSVRGFANMLAMSVVCSMISAIIVTRVLLMNLIALIPEGKLFTHAISSQKEAQ
jgi:protein-export SecD/SecF family membrane protein